MKGDRVTDSARKRYDRGLLISRIGGLAGTVGFVSIVAADGAPVGEVLGGLLVLAAMFLVHLGGLIQGEASTFLTAWAEPNRED